MTDHLRTALILAALLAAAPFAAAAETELPAVMAWAIGTFDGASAEFSGGMQKDITDLTDGKVGTDDDRMASGPSPQPTAAFALARFAMAAAPYDADRAQRAADGAARHYNGMIGYWRLKGGDTAADWRRLWFEPKAALAALYLHDLTGDARYAADLERYLPSVLDLIDRQVYFNQDYRRSNIAAVWQGAAMGPTFDFDFALLPLEYLRMHPDGAHAAACRAAVRELCDEDDPADWTNTIKYATMYYPCAAGILARDGVIPGGVVKEPVHGTGDLFYFGDAPKGFPIGFRLVVWPDKMTMGSEYYQVQGGMQLFAMWELHRARPR